MMELRRQPVRISSSGMASCHPSRVPCVRLSLGIESGRTDVIPYFRFSELASGVLNCLSFLLGVLHWRTTVKNQTSSERNTSSSRVPRLQGEATGHPGQPPADYVRASSSTSFFCAQPGHSARSASETLDNKSWEDIAIEAIRTLLNYSVSN